MSGYRNPAGVRRTSARGPLLLAVVLALAGCAGGGGPGADPELGVTGVPMADQGLGTIGEVGAPRERARAHTELAAAYFEIGNLAVALEESRIAIAADPNYAPAYNILGLVHMDLRENSQAQASFDRALRLAPNDPDINHNYGWFLCQTGREEQSLRLFMAAVRNPLYSQPQKSYTLAGVCASRKGQDAEAADMFDRALKLDPNHLPALINLAQLRYRRGDLDAARTLVSRFNRLVEPSAESIWLALRVERKLGDKPAETALADQLRRRFPASREYQDLLRGQYE